jgi:ubiquitin-like 1-activating enzyme E1 A
MGKTDVVEKKILSYPPLSTALDSSNWSLGHKETGKGGSPYRGLPRISTKEACPQVSVGILGELPAPDVQRELME